MLVGIGRANIMSDESKYFANMFCGGEEKQDMEVALRMFISFNTMAICLLLRKNFEKEELQLVLNEWRKQNIKNLNDDLAKHTDMIEGTPLGKIFGGIFPDGEELRLKYMKVLSHVQKGLEAGLFEEADEGEVK